MSIRTEVLMGTTVTIEAAGPDADAATERAFGWFGAVEQICTRFDPRSELCRLTAHPGEPVPVTPLLFEVIRFALHVADVSGGAFDPTVGAEMQRRGFNREHRSGQTVPVLVDPGEGVSYRDVDVDAAAHTVTLRRPLLLDLGAVAKGMAIDLAARELEACRDFGIDAGGDLYLGGLNGDGQPWSVGIRHPRQAGAFISAVRVSNAAICTSGTYERGDHIVNPLAAPAPDSIASVTTIASSAMLADAVATAAFVLGRDAGLDLLEQLGVEGLIVTAGLDLIPTPGWPGE